MSASSSSTPAPSSTVDPTINANIQRKLKRMRESVEDLLKQGADILAEIDKADAHHKAKLKEQYDELLQYRKQVAAEKSEWDETIAKARKVSASAPSKIKLNVGGQTHMTTIDTLTAEKGTFFDAMFSGHFDTKPDADGEIFIDRDPRHFTLIVNHMRGIDISKHVAELSESDLDQLKQDVDYFQIESLAKLLGMRQAVPIGRDWDLDETKKHNNIVLTNNEDGTTSVTTRSRAKYAPVLGNKGFSSGVHEWSVRFDSQRDYSPIVIGVCQLVNMVSCYEGYKDMSLHFVWGMESDGRKHALSSTKTEGRAWQNGDVIKATLDCDNGMFTVDGISIPIPKGEELYPVLLLFGSQPACTLLH